MKVDIVIPYRLSRSSELRYMLRSLKNLPHRNVFIIGDLPHWVDNVTHIPYRQTFDIAKNTLGILNTAIDDPRVSEDFIWVADDIFTMKPIKRLTLAHRGSYKEVLDDYYNRHKVTYYTRRMHDTYKVLLYYGIENPLCYELHIPFKINKTLWNKHSDKYDVRLNKMSMYHNLNNMKGRQMKDVKVRKKDFIPDGNFISTHEATFGANPASLLVMQTFNEVCKYERI